MCDGLQAGSAGSHPRLGSAETGLDTEKQRQVKIRGRKCGQLPDPICQNETGRGDERLGAAGCQDVNVLQGRGSEPPALDLLGTEVWPEGGEGDRGSSQVGRRERTVLQEVRGCTVRVKSRRRGHSPQGRTIHTSLLLF